jgi:hypothetical protein
MRVIGYARTSTFDGRQELSLEAQKARLVEAGAVEVFVDEETGAHRDRPGLAALLTAVRRAVTQSQGSEPVAPAGFLPPTTTSLPGLSARPTDASGTQSQRGPREQVS